MLIQQRAIHRDHHDHTELSERNRLALPVVKTQNKIRNLKTPVRIDIL